MRIKYFKIGGIFLILLIHFSCKKNCAVCYKNCYDCSKTGLICVDSFSSDMVLDSIIAVKRSLGEVCTVHKLYVNNVFFGSQSYGYCGSSEEVKAYIENIRKAKYHCEIQCRY